MIVNVGLGMLSGLINNDTAGSYTAVDYIAIGGDNTAAAAGQTGLLDQVQIAASTGTQSGTNDETLEMNHEFSFSGTDTIYEFAVFDGSTGSGTDDMLCRSVGGGISVVNGSTIDVTIKITFADA